MPNLSWHHSPAIIIALLVLVPPVGIVLMWLRLSWARNTKIAISIASMTLFGVAVWQSSVQTDDRVTKAEPAHERSTKTSTSSPPAKTPATPQEPPTPLAGPWMIEKEPLLLVPLKLDGFTLASANPLPERVSIGFAAHYTGSSGATQRLVARVFVNKSDVKMERDDNLKPMKVAQHDGHIVENTTDKSVSIRWNSSGWFAMASVDYTRLTDLAVARATVQRIAPQVSAMIDQYLTGTPPSGTERQQQLANVAQATSSTKVKEFVAKLEKAGITNDLVKNAKLDGNPNELVITVGETWHHAIRQERLIAAQNLWKLWADINSPTDPDASLIKLVDVNGNRVGGSGVMGSSIKVNE